MGKQDPRSTYEALKAQGMTATFVIGAEAANVKNVAIQLRDEEDTALGERASVSAYFSDDANGDSLIATAPSGAVAIGTDGVLYDVGAAKKVFVLSSEANGRINVNITEAGVKTLYVIVVLPSGRHVASGAVTWA